MKLHSSLLIDSPCVWLCRRTHPLESERQHYDGRGHVHGFQRWPLSIRYAAHILYLRYWPKTKNLKGDRWFLLVSSGVGWGGNDGLRSADLHPAGRRGLSPACSQVALPAEEFLRWLLFHTGRRGPLPPGLVVNYCRSLFVLILNIQAI